MLAFSTDGQLAVGYEDGSARVWSLATGKTAFVLDGHGTGCGSLAFSRDGGLLATGDYNGGFRTWDAATGKPASETEPGSGVVSIAAGVPIEPSRLSPKGGLVT